MSLKDVDIKSEYRSFRDDIVREFYIPLLSQSVIYKRAVGFFSSSALIEISKGISTLIKNGGSIQLIVSPQLSEEDIEAIEKGYELRYEIIEKCIERSIEKPKSIYEEKRLNLLANLIAGGQLDIKVSFIEANNKIGIFHEKMGIIIDSENNKVAFTGSMNETQSAFSHNYESIDVFCSWTHDSERVFAKEAAFNALWNDYEPYIKTIDFPKVAKEKLIKYRVNYSIDFDEFDSEFITRENPQKYEIESQTRHPMIPTDVIIRPYQQEAINEWEKEGFRGIFDMATGTGKTYTGLAAVVRLYQKLGNNLAVIIVAPYQHLVNQWIQDIEKFGMKPIVGHSASEQKNWKKRLNDAIRSYNLSISDHFCFICTNATFSSSYVQEQLQEIKGNSLLIVDEAHNFGAINLSNTLPPHIPYRLALSATIDRHNDQEGTEKLYSYFGKKCIEYTIKQAIDNGMLTPYEYHPIVVSLNDDELDEYISISKKIFGTIEENGKRTFSEYEKKLLIKRARIVAGASEKVIRLREVMQKYKDDNHILVYCGATTINDPGYCEGSVDEIEKKQIDIVASILGNDLGMRISKFTSEESAQEREDLKRAFDEGKHIQVLVAIRCLDEGVNIPSIKTAFILASSTNPKEYIQRRGRVLRKFPGKDKAIIYDFITLPLHFNEINNYPPEVLKSTRGLVYREIERMKDFADISENPGDADSLINQIENAFKLNMFEGGIIYDGY
ncbi:MAG: DEAD/DEAH box helicase family protein [Clostridiaceae bacterium]|nr:DEAD/DEAH box helicase family protein [Clostridiaceae bacterium]